MGNTRKGLAARQARQDRARSRAGEVTPHDRTRAHRQHRCGCEVPKPKRVRSKQHTQPKGT